MFLEGGNLLVFYYLSSNGSSGVNVGANMLGGFGGMPLPPMKILNFLKANPSF
jgi:hypothetical protein